MSKMAVREKQNPRNESWIFMLALILAAVIFFFGLLLGNYIAMSKLDDFKQTEERFLVDLIAQGMREEILQENICNTSVGELFEVSSTLGNMLTKLERRFGKEDEDVLAKKQIYELLEIKTLQTLEQVKQECDRDFNIVLFFYTNRKNDAKGSDGLSETQGLVLDQLVYEHNEGRGSNVFVFSFDINSRNQATKALIAKYGVSNVPSLLINEVSYGYLNKVKLDAKLA